MAASSNSVNHASGLPAMDNKSMQIILGTRISNIIIQNYRRTLPINLFLSVDMDVDLCGTVTYLCEDQADLPRLSDSALDAGVVRRVISPPKTVTFSGFRKGSFETKMSKEQLECINRSDVLRNWLRTSLMQTIEDGKQSIMARFYRHLITEGVHPKNTGLNAGLQEGGQVLGTQDNPVELTPDGVDDWYMAILNTIKQMPRSVSVGNEYGLSTEQAFLFAPAQVESLNMKNANYNSWQISGECANCSLFSDKFDRMPRGIMTITSRCIEPYIVSNGGNTCKAYPVLFGRRYQGTKAALRIDTKTYDSADGESTFFRSNFYWHIHTYDCRNMGLSWVTINDTQPKTTSCG